MENPLDYKQEGTVSNLSDSQKSINQSITDGLDTF